MYVYAIFIFLANILKETSDAKSEIVLWEWTPPLCLRFVLNDMRLVTTFIIAMYGDMIMPKLVAFYAKLNETYKKINFILRMKFLSVHKARNINKF